MTNQDDLARRTTSPQTTPQPAGGDTSRRDGEDVLDIIADVEAKLAKMRSFQQEHNEQIASLTQRADAMQQSQQQLDGMTERLREQETLMQQREQALSQKSREFEASQEQMQRESRRLEEERRALSMQAAALAKQQAEDQQSRRELESQLSRQTSALSQREAQLGRLQAEIESQQSALAAEQQRMQTQQKEHREMTQLFEEEQRQLTEQVRGAESRIEQMTQQLETLTRELKQQQDKVQAAAVELSELKAARDRHAKAEQEALGQTREIGEKFSRATASLSQRETELAQAREKLDTAGRKLAEFAKALSEQGEQLERGAAALAEVELQRRQIDQLQKQVAQLKLSSNVEEMQRKEHRIGELTEALHQARGQKPADEDLVAFENRITQLNQELEQARIEASQAREEAQQLRASAQKQGGSQQDLSQIQQMLEQATAEANQLRQANEDLHKQLEEAQQKSAATGKAASPEQSKLQEQLKAKALKIKAAAEHLQRRKARLRRMLDLVRQHSQDHGQGETQAEEAKHEEYEERMRAQALLTQQREQLRAKQELLAANEQDMIRRWARPRAVSTLAWLTVFMAIAGVTSWFAAGKFFPATIAASVVVNAEPRSGHELTPEDAAKWQEWHSGLLADAAFHKAVAKRLESRHVAGLSDEAAVGAKLAADLRIDASAPGSLTLSLAGPDTPETSLLLDTVASALAAESARQAGKRSDGAKAVIAGERKVEGQVRFAAVSPTPLVDERLKYAGIIFAVSCLLGLLLVAVIYSRLMRSKRMFEAQTAPDEAPDHESAIPIR